MKKIIKINKNINKDTIIIQEYALKRIQKKFKNSNLIKNIKKNSNE